MEMGLQKGVKAAGPKGKAGLVFRSGPRGRPPHPQAPACAIPPVCKQWKTSEGAPRHRPSTENLTTNGETGNTEVILAEG